MNILSVFIRKNMLVQKKRTVLTLLGVCLSVAMMVAVSSFLQSYMERGRSRNEAVIGKWTAVFYDIPYSLFPEIEREMPGDTFSLANDVGYVRLPDNRQPDRPYLLISQYDAETLHTLNIRLTDGYFPTKSNEILVPNDLGDFFDHTFHLGDTFTWEIGDRVLSDGKKLSRFFPLEKNDEDSIIESLQITQRNTYTIVGFIDRAITDIPGTTFFSCITAPNPLGFEGDSEIILYLHNENPSGDYSARVNRLSDRLSIPDGKLVHNFDLLSYYPQGLGSYVGNNFYSMSVFVMGAIFVTGFILIYNSFSISSSTRISQMGLLASVGATQRQKRNTILLEGFYVCLFGIPIGIFAGLFSIYFLLQILELLQSDSYDHFPFVFSPEAILTASLLATASILLALLIPAIRAAHIMPLEAIQLGDAPPPPKKMRQTQGWMRIFHIEGVLAQENVRSNPQQKGTLIFSLSLSLIVFFCISFYIFTYFLGNQFATESGTSPATSDILLDIGAELSDENKEQLFSQLQALPQAEKALMVERIDGAYVDNTQMYSYRRTERLQEKADLIFSFYEENYCPVFVLDDENFSAYLEDLGENPDYYLKKPIAVFYQNPLYSGFDGNLYTEGDINHFFPMTTNDSVRDVVDFFEQAHTKLTIGKNTSILPSQFSIQNPDAMPRGLFISKSFAQLQIAENSSGSHLQIFIHGRNHILLENDIRHILKTYSEDSYSLINNTRSRETKETQKTIFNLLSFVFLILIGVLSMSNSLHSLSTSLSLRRREFSMLRSVGMTPRAFQKMLFLEGLYYCFSTLLIAIPISLFINLILSIHQKIPLTEFFSSAQAFSLLGGYLFDSTFFSLIPLLPYTAGTLSVFFCVFVSQHIVVREMKNQNIVDIMKARNM